MGANMKRAFLDVKRQAHSYRPIEERIRDFNEVEVPPAPDVLKIQAERCMDCGIPFCHGCGCPLENQIPEINAAVAAGRLADAWDLLASTSNFPEFTSRVCPALCEASCTAGQHLDPVTIRQIERYTVDAAFEQGLVKIRRVTKRSGKSVAVVGAGPAGLAAADILNQHGHKVTVFERDRFPGGLLRYGIPDFKLDKGVIERRIKLLEAEGVVFETGVNIGIDISCDYLKRKFDAIVIATGTRAPRDLNVPGRETRDLVFLPATVFPGKTEPTCLRRGFRRTSLHGKRKKSARNRRRRYRIRLRRNLHSSGGEIRHADRNHAEAARNALRQHPLARMALHAAHLLQPSGRMRPPLEHLHQGLPGEKRIRPARLLHRDRMGTLPAGETPEIHGKGRTL